MSALVTVVRDAMDVGKRFRHYLPEAKRRGMEIAVAIDSRTTDATREFARRYADHVVEVQFGKDEVCEKGINPLLEQMASDCALWVSDDEMPSPALWDFAAGGFDRPLHLTMETPTPDGRIFIPGQECQVRLLQKGMKWRGNWRGYLERGGSAAGSVGLILWHWQLFVDPRSLAAKHDRYNALGAGSEFFRRFTIDGAGPECFRDMTDDEARELL